MIRGYKKLKLKKQEGPKGPGPQGPGGMEVRRVRGRSQGNGRPRG